MMIWLSYWSVISLIVAVCIVIIRRFDDEEWTIYGRHRAVIAVVSAVNSSLICMVTEGKYIQGLLLAMVAGTLLFACITDSLRCQVFRFVWWLEAVAAGLLYGIQAGCNGYCNDTHTFLVEFLLYTILQELFFSRFYGRADCHAFVLCALVGSLYGMTMREYLIHMLVSFGLLTIVQGLRRNISRKGNLKQPVAFLPYVTIAFWIILVKISV